MFNPFGGASVPPTTPSNPRSRPRADGQRSVTPRAQTAPAASGNGMSAHWRAVQAQVQRDVAQTRNLCPVCGGHTVVGHESMDKYALACIIAQSGITPAQIAQSFNVRDYFGKGIW